ncbi:MAG TPA: hypothetical protein GX716_08525 [Firmicutes bacterium]|nr:hypothetical protein [Candidatus Fermentithermobacillaceae bacterium]
MADDKGSVTTLVETIALFTFYRDEAERCRESGAYLASCVLLASALEAALLAMVECFAHEVAEFTRKFKGKARELSRPRREWGLSQLLLIARHLDWLPSSHCSKGNLDPHEAKVGDYIEVVRVIRNLIHPAIYLREYPGEPITEKHLDISYKVLEIACDCLSDRLESALKAKRHDSKHRRPKTPRCTN